jgi:hypothetical protein
MQIRNFWRKLKEIILPAGFLLTEFFLNLFALSQPATKRFFDIICAQFVRSNFWKRRVCAGGIVDLLAIRNFCAGTLPALFEMNPASA